MCPTGFIWDSVNFSCAYDSLLTVLWSLWRDDPVTCTESYSRLSSEMNVLVQGFNQIIQGQTTLEVVRDSVREILHLASPQLFPVGHRYAAVSDVAAILLSSRTCTSSTITCDRCGYTLEGMAGSFCLHLIMSVWTTSSTSVWLQNHLQRLGQSCPQCLMRDLNGLESRMINTTTIGSTPPLLFLEIPTSSEYRLDAKLELAPECGLESLSLRGVIYYESNHFVTRIISKIGDIWFHDGIATGRHCIYEGNISNPDLLRGLCRHGSKKAVAVVYA
ncbi:hypothetical protein C8J57DRAFT_1100426 [Mycena rebaudengoi]|nr:hypothetical protein C8J57DRAFT_1100426 [Mycena rebaudengoi]